MKTVLIRGGFEVCRGILLERNGVGIYAMVPDCPLSGDGCVSLRASLPEGVKARELWRSTYGTEDNVPKTAKVVTRSQLARAIRNLGGTLEIQRLSRASAPIWRTVK